MCFLQKCTFQIAGLFDQRAGGAHFSSEINQFNARNLNNLLRTSELIIEPKTLDIINNQLIFISFSP